MKNKLPNDQFLNFNVTINDGFDGDEFDMSLTTDEMLINGSRVNMEGEGDQVCYLPFFSQDAIVNRWIFGSAILSKYYMVFD